MKLGELIKWLEIYPKDYKITFKKLDGSFQIDPFPEELESYRGDYSHLALSSSKIDSGKTVGDLVEQLNEAFKKVYTGYKGGKYTMTWDTPVWASEYGYSSGDAIVGIECFDEVKRVFLLVANIRYYS